jgi:hypothetical protein
MAIQSYSRALGSPPLPTILEVNDETGEAFLYANGGSNGKTLLATADNVGDEWSIRNQFRQRWNLENGLSLSRGEFDDVFNNDIKKTINKDKASLINTHSNNSLKKTLKDAGVPGVKDPVTGTTTQDTTDTPTTASDSNDQGGDSSKTSSDSDSINSNSNGNINIPSIEGTGMPSTGKVGILKYPIDMSVEMNKLQINIIEYKPKGVAGTSGSFEVGERQKGKVLTTIFLPVPGGISDQNQVSWNKGDMNALQAAAAEFAVNAIEGGPKDATEAAKAIVGRLKINKEDAKQLVVGAMAGAASGLGSQLLTRQTGAIINPNTELLFNGPSMRNFGFSFNMSARSEKEAQSITFIIRALKQGMSVRRSESGLFLLSPHIFELKYLAGSSQLNPHLNQFKMCAMTGLNVNYTPNQTFMTFANNMPVAYQVDMQFSELEPIFNDDYKDDNSIGF